MEAIDALKLNFSEESLFILNLSLGFIMFGVALDLRIADFQRVFKIPKLILVGLTSQLLLLPLVTLGLVYILQPMPSLALGMFLLAACPGGNVSNFMTSWAGGNVALSVSMTAVVNIFAVIVTPFNFTFWSSFYEPASTLLQTIELNFFDFAQTFIIILVIPITLGMSFASRFPDWADKIKRPMKILSILIFFIYVGVAFALNFEYFLDFVKFVVIIVFIHNTAALLLGYHFAGLMGLKKRERRTIAIETGIQNSGIALVLIFNFFDGLGGMALITGWWSIWHLTSGMSLSSFWSKRPVEE
jgi:BASS family bile acid:Na+ symporter